MRVQEQQKFVKKSPDSIKLQLKRATSRESFKEDSAAKGMEIDEDFLDTPENLKQKYGADEYNKYVKELRDLRKVDHAVYKEEKKIQSGEYSLADWEKLPENVKAIAGRELINNLGSFSKEDQKVVIASLVENGQGLAVLRNNNIVKDQVLIDLLFKKDPFLAVAFVENFNSKNQLEIAQKAFQFGKGRDLLHFIDKYDPAIHTKIATMALEKGLIFEVTHKLDSFKGVDPEKFALKLIELGQGDLVISYAEKFPANIHNKIFMKLIEKFNPDQLAFILKNFRGLNRESLEKLLSKISNNYIMERVFAYAEEAGIDLGLKYQARYKWGKMFRKGK